MGQRRERGTDLTMTTKMMITTKKKTTTVMMIMTTTMVSGAGQEALILT